MTYSFKAHLAAERKECRQAPIRVLDLTQMRTVCPSLSPREQAGTSTGGREASAFQTGLCAHPWKCRSVGGGSVSALPAGRQAQHMSRFSTSLLH